ncbi:hypothetical protein BZA77DRAFT_298130 [Pyronema omphalodes]|nr:hypothetical protein BZA77DRAFT_298477 [Pyronema omphalodes]KAI5806009.1 hypothetical protein BZA77DRAFT_298478 [Pyronema omphalodes]KAI5806010.1 hypothetical protein BZA77DRAFT_298479 [Pyronema omphalodes]KAI5809269.1 hypothetical protein BZA77DRAFT_298129 [Pyronema omphalodes]KAI5809270.1 hypothetical protein BZA77DRAFT_298130 [Pyronema omphalodes]
MAFFETKNWVIVENSYPLLNSLAKNQHVTLSCIASATPFTFIHFIQKGHTYGVAIATESALTAIPRTLIDLLCLIDALYLISPSPTSTTPPMSRSRSIQSSDRDQSRNYWCTGMNHETTGAYLHPPSCNRNHKVSTEESSDLPVGEREGVRGQKKGKGQGTEDAEGRGSSGWKFSESVV